MIRVYSFYTGLYIKIFKKKKIYKWHPLNENGLAQIERIEKSTKHKSRVLFNSKFRVFYSNILSLSANFLQSPNRDI